MNIDQIVIVKENINYKLHPSGLVEAEDLITGKKVRTKSGKSFTLGMSICRQLLRDVIATLPKRVDSMIIDDLG